MIGAVKGAETRLDEPFARLFAMLTGQTHEHRGKPLVHKGQGAFLVRSACVDADRLEGEGHAAIRPS